MGDGGGVLWVGCLWSVSALFPHSIPDLITHDWRGFLLQHGPNGNRGRNNVCRVAARTEAGIHVRWVPLRDCDSARIHNARDQAQRQSRTGTRLDLED